MKHFVFLALIILLTSGFTLSQDRTDSVNTTSAWLQAGLGFSGVKFHNAKVGLLLGLGTTAKWEDNLISFRFNRNIEINILGPKPEEEVWTIEALYGRSFSFSTKRAIVPLLLPIGLLFKGNFNYLFNISAGMSYVGLKERTTILHFEFFNTTYNYKKTGRFGVPLELELINLIERNFALGTGVYSNINQGKIFLGFRGNLYIGIF